MNKMTCAGLTALAALGLAASGPAAHATVTVIAGYDFENLPTNSGTAQAPATIAADLGVNKSTSSLTAGGTMAFSSIEPDNSTPSYAYINGGDDMPGTSTASTYALRLGIGQSTSTTSANNGSALIFNADTTGYNGITVSYDTYASSASSFLKQTLYYSTNGTSFTAFSPAYSVPQQSTAMAPVTGADAAGYSLASFDLSTITGLNNDPNAKFEIVFSGAPGYTATPAKAPNDRFDNLSVTGTASGGASPAPEPSQVGMMALMGLGLGGLILRAKKKQSAA